MNKHDYYVAELEEKISSAYENVINDYVIKENKRLLGQADLIAKNGNTVDIYEVKCSYRIHKAVKQLKRLQKLLHAHGRLFFYCGISGELKEIY